MLNLPLFGKEKLLLAFEYGMTIAKTAQDMKVELTPKIMEAAEIMLESEFRMHDATYLAQPANMVPNILTAFELDMTK